VYDTKPQSHIPPSHCPLTLLSLTQTLLKGLRGHGVMSYGVKGVSSAAGWIAASELLMDEGDPDSALEAAKQVCTSFSLFLGVWGTWWGTIVSSAGTCQAGACFAYLGVRGVLGEGDGERRVGGPCGYLD
jgi:hypothetical protein